MTVSAVTDRRQTGAMVTWFDALADVLWGSTCPGCGQPAAGVCAACATRLVPRVRAVGAWVELPVLNELATTPALAGGRYDGPLGAVIVAVKDAGRHDLLWVLEEHAVAAASRLPGSDRPSLIVPVPSSPAAVRRRGLDVTYRLARAVARHRGGRARRLLRPTRRVADQAGLRADERARNMRGAFTVRGRPPRGTPVVLVDDVVTTGATAQACASALSRAGLEVHGTVFAAVTPPPGTPRLAW